VMLCGLLSKASGSDSGRGSRGKTGVIREGASAPLLHPRSPKKVSNQTHS
jgi:hypothetical protein